VVGEVLCWMLLARFEDIEVFVVLTYGASISGLEETGAAIEDWRIVSIRSLGVEEELLYRWVLPPCLWYVQSYATREEELEEERGRLSRHNEVVL